MKKATKRPERELTNAIIALLWAHNIPCWRTGVGAFPAEYGGTRRFVRMGTRGMADIVGVVPVSVAVPILWPSPIPRDPRGGYRFGRALAIEVKSPTGRIRPEQLAFLQEVVRAGGIGFVARSVTDVVEKLGFGRGPGGGA